MFGASATVHDIQLALETKKLSSAELVDDCLGLINLHNQHLNAMREINPAAKEIARRMDQERRKGLIRSMLHGIPVVIKDVFHTGDALSTSYGVVALKNLRSSFSSTIVTDLREAGAIILGKCSCTDFGDYMSSIMPAEHSGTGGTVINPKGVRYGRGAGSSTGCSSAVAADFAPLAIASEAQNSIQGPAANTGLVGLKPTVGRLKKTPEPSLVASHATAGFICRSVADVAVCFALTKSGADSCSSSNAHPSPQANNYRVGIPRRRIFGRQAARDYDDTFEALIPKLDGMGITLIDNADITTIDDVLDTPSSVFRTEFKRDIDLLLANAGVSCEHRNLQAIIDFNQKNAETAIPYGQDLIVAAEEASDANPEVYLADRQRDIMLTRDKGIDWTLNKHHLDALIVPMDFAAKVTGKAGYPVLTLPCGATADNKPFAISLIATANQEQSLINIGQIIEKRLKID